MSYGQSVVDLCQSAFEVPLLGFELGEQALEEWHSVQCFFLCPGRDSPPQLCDARLAVAEPSPRPSRRRLASVLGLANSVDILKDFRCAKGWLRVAEADFNPGLCAVRVDQLGDMIGGDGARD